MSEKTLKFNNIRLKKKKKKKKSQELIQYKKEALKNK